MNIQKTILTIENPNKVFFTSDTHFCHENIIKFCKRPFISIEDMNEQLIRNWNNIVPEDGIVFHLGDFIMGGFTKWKPILERLNGTIYLILGNHDVRSLRNVESDKLTFIGEQLQIKIENRYVYLNHYPFLCYGGTYRESADQVWQLFGHVHSGPNSSGLDCDKLKYLFPTQYDVGVDNNNYRPISWFEVKQIINNQVLNYARSRN